jgi:putative transposase
VILAKKVRLYPILEQEQQMWKSAGIKRFAYNWTLTKQQENYKNGGKFISDGNLRKDFTQLKKQEEYLWLNEVSNNIPKQAIKDACTAYMRFFKKQASFPKFKSKKHEIPSFYNDNVKLKVKKDSVLLEKVGWVKIKEKIPLVRKYTKPTVSYDGKYWYLSVGIEQQESNIELTNTVLGIDVGIKDLAITSNLDLKFKNINKTKKVKKIEKKKRRLQRKVSNKYLKNKKGESYHKTSNIKKLEKQIRLVQRKLNGIRKNHLHQATNKIVKTKPSKVVMETLNISGMMKNKHLSKAIQQQNLYEFKRQMKYKCEFNGIEFVEADKWYPSSKTCSECGHIKKSLSLSERTYICEECDCIIDRDYNAAINLSRYSA